MYSESQVCKQFIILWHCEDSSQKRKSKIRIKLKVVLNLIKVTNFCCLKSMYYNFLETSLNLEISLLRSDTIYVSDITVHMLT